MSHYYCTKKYMSLHTHTHHWNVVTRYENRSDTGEQGAFDSILENADGCTAAEIVCERQSEFASVCSFCCRGRSSSVIRERCTLSLLTHIQTRRPNSDLVIRIAARRSFRHMSKTDVLLKTHLSEQDQWGREMTSIANCFVDKMIVQMNRVHLLMAIYQSKVWVLENPTL